MLTTTLDNEEIIERVAALDIGKSEVMCCVRVPDDNHPGSKGAGGAGLSGDDPLGAEAGRLPGLTMGVTRVVMEATADYWKPVLPAGRRPGSGPGW